MTSPSTELVPFDSANPSGTSAFPVLFDQEGEGGITQVLQDNFGDEGFSPTDLDRVKVPAGGGTTWEIPDEEPTRIIEGVIIHKQPTRSMWFKARGEDGEDDTPPDCYSTDAKLGVGAFGQGSESNPGGSCADCPMNVFGSSTSGSGKGKACKEQMQVFLVQPGSILPLQVSLPPTSLRGFRQYMTRLASKGKSYMAVVSGFSLKVEKGGGQTYSVVEPGKVRDLDPMEAAAARAYGTTIADALIQVNAERMAMEAAGESTVAGSAVETQPLEETAPTPGATPPAKDEAAPAAKG